MDITRRRLLVTAVGLAAAATGVAGLSGCNASADPGAAAGSPSAAAGGAEDGAFPVTLTHRFGETTIEAEPKRVVCVGLKEQDDLLAVGVVPVGASTWLEFPDGSKILGPWTKDALGTAPVPETLDSTNGIPFEAVAALEPDLILALYAGPSEADYTKLSAIAPTVSFPKEYVNYGIPWDVQAEIVGRAVGRPQAMAARIAASKKAVTDAAAANPSFQGQTTMVITPYEGLYVYGSQDPRTRLMNELGLVNPPGFEELFASDTDTFGGNISPEKAEILDVGVLVCFADEGAQQQEIETNLFKNQQVYKEGRTIWLRTGDDATLPFSFLTALSLPYLLEAFVPRVVAAADGDPATSTEQAA
jgi:iron complex transport system substrate-binding protein